MNGFVDFLAREGAMLLAGSSLVLACGGLSIVCLRAPIHRQRAAELTMLAVLLWLPLATLPLPRWQLSSDGNVDRQRPTAASLEKPSASSSVALLPGLPFETSRPERRPSTAPAPDRHPAASGSPAPHSTAGRPPSAITVNDVTDPSAAADAEAAPRLADRRTTDRLGRWQVPDIRWVLAAIYLAGGALCLGWLLLGRILLWRLLSNAHAPDQSTARLFASLAQPHGLRARLLVSSRVGRPLSCGLFPPTIVVPTEYCRPHRAEPLRQVLLHELAHVQQCDSRGHQLFHLTLPLLYFHPLYWLIRWTAQLSRELVADDWAARHSTAQRYARELIALARASSAGRACPGTLAMFTSPSQFYRRMTMLLSRDKPLDTKCSHTWRAFSLGAVVALAGGAAAVWGVRPSAAQVDEGGGNAPSRFEETEDTGAQSFDRADETGLDARADDPSSRAEVRRARDDVQEEPGAAAKDPSRDAVPAEDPATLSPPAPQDAPGDQTKPAETPFWQPRGSLELSAARSPLDLVRLAEVWSDTEAAIQVARAKVEASRELVDQQVVSKLEALVDEIALRNAMRKRELLGQIGQAAAESIQAQLDATSELRDLVRRQYEAGQSGLADYQAILAHQAELNANLKILQLILDQSPAVSRDAQPGDRKPAAAPRRPASRR